jgi:hypothetical protein
VQTVGLRGTMLFTSTNLMLNGISPILYLPVRLRASVPSLALIAASSAVLHASLSSAFFSLRQVVISSALGMNELQSLNTSGVHARRDACAPCENEGAGETVADSRASDTHHFAQAIGRSILLFRFSIFVT